MSGSLGVPYIHEQHITVYMNAISMAYIYIPHIQTTPTQKMFRRLGMILMNDTKITVIRDTIQYMEDLHDALKQVYIHLLVSKSA